MRARGYGAGLRARCQCVAERATALKARVLHARAWNIPEDVTPLDIKPKLSLSGRTQHKTVNKSVELKVQVERTDGKDLLRLNDLNQAKPKQ